MIKRYFSLMLSGLMLLLAIGFGSIQTSFAQGNNNSQASAQTYFTNNQTLINQFNAAVADGEAFQILDQIKTEIVNEAGALKLDLTGYSLPADQTAYDAKLDFLNNIGNKYNEIMQVSRDLQDFDRTAVSSLLNEYINLHH